MNSTETVPLWNVVLHGRQTFGKRKGRIHADLCSDYYCFLLSGKDRFYFAQYLESVNTVGEAIEVGTFLGESASNFLLKWRKCSKMFCIDSYDNAFLAKMDPQEARTGDEIYASTKRELSRRFPGQIHIFRQSAQDAAKSLKTNHFEFIYIDGDHSYEGCLNDLEPYFPLARTGGLMSGHDYSAPGVARAVHDFIKAHRELKGVSLFITDEHPPSFAFFKP